MEKVISRSSLGVIDLSKEIFGKILPFEDVDMAWQRNSDIGATKPAAHAFPKPPLYTYQRRQGPLQVQPFEKSDLNFLT